MRILGLDCGLEKTGYGLIESDGRRHRLVQLGVIKTKPGQPIADRLRLIQDGIAELLTEFQPQQAALEEVFARVNIQSALKLAHVRGAAMALLAGRGVAVHEYTAATIKLSLVGTGRAEKEQVELMVRTLLGLREAIASDDASDAAAVAICHAHHAASSIIGIGKR
jgi:crossover junction endodeoxyribonuclease RuvC